MVHSIRASNRRLDAFGGERSSSILSSNLSNLHTVDYVFVDHPSFHRKGGLYGDSHGVYGDELPLHALIPRCVRSAARFAIHRLWWILRRQDVVFVANDWLGRVWFRRWSPRATVRTVCTRMRERSAIHNILHQGVEPATTFPNLGCAQRVVLVTALEYKYPEYMRAHDDAAQEFGS